MIEKISGDFELGDDSVSIVAHRDTRGELAELFREDKRGGLRLRQWNLVRNNANVMRGMHVHPVHADFIVVIQGDMLLALHDVRPDSPGRGKSGIFRLAGDNLNAVYVPPGVVHGFYIPRGNLMVYGLSNEWSMDDEFACKWNDPGLRLIWPESINPVISERDRNAGTLAELTASYLAATA